MDIASYIKQLDRQMKEYDAIYHAAAVKFGLSDTALWILYLVSDSAETYTQQDLCQECLFPKQTINTALNNLIKGGYALLEPIPGTRNSKRIMLTDSGRGLAENTAEKLKKAELAAYRKFDNSELELYLRTTARFNEYLREEFEKTI